MVDCDNGRTRFATAPTRSTFPDTSPGTLDGRTELPTFRMNALSRSLRLQKSSPRRPNLPVPNPAKPLTTSPVCAPSANFPLGTFAPIDAPNPSPVFCAASGVAAAARPANATPSAAPDIRVPALIATDSPVLGRFVVAPTTPSGPHRVEFVRRHA